MKRDDEKYRDGEREIHSNSERGAAHPLRLREEERE
jgi:hypothetical protein